MAQYDFLPPWLWGVSIEHVEMNEINPWHMWDFKFVWSLYNWFPLYSKALLDLLVNQNVHYFYAGTVLLDGHEAKGERCFVQMNSSKMSGKMLNYRRSHHESNRICLQNRFRSPAFLWSFDYILEWLCPGLEQYRWIRSIDQWWLATLRDQNEELTCLFKN